MSSRTRSAQGIFGATAKPIGLFVAAVFSGIVGFTVLAGIGLVDAAFWLLDPTSLELHFETHDGPERLTKAYALVIFSVLILSGLWVGESVLDTVFGGQFQEELGRVQTRQAIDNLRNHTIICGYGMFGQTVAKQLRARGEDIVIIEQNEDVLKRVDEETLALEGDARREDVLQDAGIQRARAVIAGIDDSNVNIQIGIVTSQLGPDARLVVRVGEEMYESLAKRAGADAVVIPEVVSGTDVVDRL